jgi:putative cell wall-binding protein
VAVGLLAGALSVFGIALAPSAGATADATVDRVAGATRYGTAAAVSTEAYPDGNGCVLIASGENFPDALAASGLAGADGCPILLVMQDSIPEETSAAIDELGADTATIVGGTAAVSQAVEDSLADDLGLDVNRVAGATRYETAAAVADAIGDNSTVIVASGEVAPDALAAGPIAADQKAPILLVQTNNVPAATEDALGGSTNVIIVGGTARISNATQSDIEDASDDADGATRLAGQNRQETSVEIANYEVDTLGWAPTSALLAAPSAPNDDFSPDALVAGPLGGLRQAPVLIVTDADNLGPAGDFLDDHSDTITEVLLIGGTAVLSDDLLNDAETAVQNTSNDGGTTPTNATATSRPELVSASIVETRTSAASTATRPPGTYVKYCFDEAVTGAAIDATKFHLYNGDGTRFSGTGTSAPAGQTFSSGVTAADNKCVEVIYPALATATSAANLTLATVEKGAATGAAGATTDTNIEGDAPLTPASSSAAAAGVTAAPDLVSVGGFREGSTVDVTAVDFTFDQAAFVQSGAFQLVGTNGTTYSCQGPAAGSTTASGLAAPGGQGTTVITVNCAQPGTPGSSVPFTATNVARGVVQQNAVATTAAGANPNPLEAAPVANSGNSDAPDLVAVVFSPDALVGQDVVSYLFDEAVAAGTVPLSATTFAYATSSSFGIYDTNGTQRNTNATFVAGTEFCTRSSENNAVVSCVLADGVLAGATYVGGNVRAGAVTETDGAKTNGADEEGTSPSAGPSTGTSGLTAGPDLTGVTINTVTTPFGNTTYTATYTFDEDTADAFNGGGANINFLMLYTADGLELVCTALAGGLSSGTTLANRAEDVDNTITCSSYTVGVGGATATTAQVHSAVVGAVAYSAINDETQGVPNPEGAALTSGGNGTPVA